MRPNRKYGKSSDGETFPAERSQREYARSDDRAGGLRLSQNAVIDLLLQGEKGRYSGYKARKAPLYHRDELDKWLESSRKTPAPH